jgi:hypothetical protein
MSCCKLECKCVVSERAANGGAMRVRLGIYVCVRLAALIWRRSDCEI